jgi:hypothetical protein
MLSGNKSKSVKKFGSFTGVDLRSGF